MSYTTDNYITSAQKKVERKWYDTFVLAILAGMFIAFGAVASSMVSDGTTLGTFLKAVIFPVGLILVIFIGAELFTGNNLLFLPLCTGNIKASSMFKNWIIVYAGNFIGGLLIAVFVSQAHILPYETLNTILHVKTYVNFVEVFAKAVLCNVLVCLAVWLSCGAKTEGGKICFIHIPIFIFVICGFEHCVANMYYLSSGLMVNFTWELFGRAILDNLIPSTIGNIIGGVLFSSVIYLIERQK